MKDSTDQLHEREQNPIGPELAEFIRSADHVLNDRDLPEEELTMKRALDFCERDNWTGDMSAPTGPSTESAVDEPKTSHKVLSVYSISSILLF